MGTFLNRLRDAWRDTPRRKKAAAVIAGCLVLAMIYAVWPRRVDEVVRFDGEGGWQRESAPPRRMIVWEPAERLPLPESDSESITPALSDGGATLYFSRRSKSEPAEILRTHLRHGRWEVPQPVVELNSPADDIGPILSADGTELYFYSNRAGGRGGYDLYVSTWDQGRWSMPKNLGPGINTTANEYDPCLDPSGRVLYFASNRTPQMAERASAGNADEKAWAGSLRAEPGQMTFDLYRAARENPEAGWTKPANIVELNTPETNEGAPAFSPDGAFLYFASDRPARGEEAANLDLYRARLIEGEIAGPVENLGPGINTSAHETEPSLSPEGFRLLFASNRDGADGLYLSTATEVYEQTTRDTSRLKALANPWLWAGLFCGTLLLFAIYFVYSHRGTVAQKLWPARFLAASILINIGFVLLLFLWKLPGIVDSIVKQFQEPLPASRVVDQETVQAQEARETLYSKVADLPPVETTAASWPSGERSAVSSPMVDAPPVLPEDDRLPLSNSIPAHIPQTIVAVRPRVSSPETLPQPVLRTQPQNAVAMLPAEEAVKLPQSLPRPLEEISSDTSIERLQSANVEMRIPAPARTSDQMPVRPETVPLPAKPTSPEIPFRDSTPENLARQSPREPEPKQIASLDQFSLEPVPNPAEEQFTPAEPAEREREQPVVHTTLKVPEEASQPAGETALKNQPAELRPNPSAPKWTGTSQANRAVPALEKPGVPKVLAKVAELDVLPELAEASSPGQENLPLPEPPMASEQNGPPVVFEPPVPSAANRGSLPRMQTQANLKRPGRPEPKLSRPMLEPAASVAMSAEPVEVHEPVELASLLALRNPDTRREMASVLGRRPAEEEAAVKRGLLWLAKHQNEDGSWSLNEFHNNCKKHGGKKCSGAGGERSNAAATGLALLPFLAAGYVPGSKEYGEVVSRGLDWLVKNQHEDGKLQGAGDNQVMYSHGIATIALCEAFAMTREPRLGEAAKKAVGFIVKAQHPSTGGWRYNPGEPGDTSVVGWQVMALKSAEMAGIEVPPGTYDKVHKWLASVEGNQPVGGVFGYTNRSPSPAMAAEGLLCLEFLNERRASPRLQAGADYLISHLPRKDQRHTSYYWYYATQVLYHLQDDRWTTWNETLRKVLFDSQEKSGSTEGTWAPKDRWEQRGGRIYSTSLKLLLLEIEYRHLPLYGSLKPIIEP